MCGYIKKKWEIGREISKTRPGEFFEIFDNITMD